MLALICAAAGAFAYLDRNAPLDPRDKPGFLTPIQYRMAGLTVERCRAALNRGGADFTPVSRPMAEGCGYPEGVAIRGSTVDYGARLVLDCRAALALEMWERHVMQPAAHRHLGAGIDRVTQYGTYSCRNINHATHGRRSEHATAQAVDIAGFTTTTGRRVSMIGNWKDEGPAGAFLRELRDGACRYFRTVLSPDYNSAHLDHFHLGMRRSFLCR